MQPKKRKHPEEKTQLHPRSKHRQRYDFKQLTESLPALKPLVSLNKYKDESVDFANPEAVKMLNTAILKHHYGIDHWNIPEGYLCPPIPGRMDYLHYIADLLGNSYPGKIPIGNKVVGLDVGAGANCIYPILGAVEYGWNFIASDIDPTSVKSGQAIISKNAKLEGKIDYRLQPKANNTLRGILQEGEMIDFTICNPPFHGSKTEADAGNMRKVSNLKGKRAKKPALNFGGKSKELWTEGGERRFVRDMIFESRDFSSSCLWFTTLVSKETYLEENKKSLRKAKALDIKVIPMGQGNKKSRILAWSFFSPKQQKVWGSAKWK